MAIEQSGTRYTLVNDWLRRQIDTAEGPVTTAYHLRPAGSRGGDTWLPTFAFSRHQPFEAAVCVKGQWHQSGPWTPNSDNWDKPGAFTVAESSIVKTDLGQALVLRCQPRGGQAPAVELTLRYEIADAYPLLVKQVTVKNVGDTAITVDNLAVESFKQLRYGRELCAFTDYYWKTQCPDDYYAGWTRMQLEQPINLPLKPSESFDSFRLFQVAAPTDTNGAASAWQRCIKAAAPWITQPMISQQVAGCESYDELAAIAPQAADNGIEAVHFFAGQLHDYCGDYIPNPELFPNGDDDVTRLVEHFHQHGLKVLPYCSLTIASHHTKVRQEHMDWEYHGPDGMRYRPEAFGNMCYQSDWSGYITAKLDHLLDVNGFDGLHIDGPYHGLPCLATHHRHRTPESVPFMNWQWERDFYARMRGRGAYITVPQEWQAFLLGANARPGGYTEEDYHEMGGLPLVSAFRSRLYDTRARIPACGSWCFLSLDPYHGHSIEASEANPASYDHALGGTFGYGHFGYLHGRKLFLGPKTEAVFRRWIDFYKRYRQTLAGEQLHLARPDGHRPDGMLHVNAAADPPAVAVLFNPADEPARFTCTLPLEHAGFVPGDKASIDGAAAVTLDARAAAVLDVTLDPFEVKAVDVKREVQRVPSNT